MSAQELPGPDPQPVTEAVQPCPPLPAGFQAGDMVGGYQLVRHVHGGSFGQVWIGRHCILGDRCAVKVVPDGLAGKVELEGVRNYKRVADRNDGLVPIRELGAVPGKGFYYTMPLADDVGGPAVVRDVSEYEPMTLQRYCEMHRPVPIDRVISVAVQLLPSLHALHEAGLIHRDVKPANVVRVEGVWKFCDPGLVTRRDRIRGDAGTPAFVPPEGARDRRADLYAFGVTLYLLATDHSLAQVGEFVSGRRGVPGEDARRGPLSDVLRRACSPDPALRLQTALEMYQRVSALVRTTKVTVTLDEGFSTFTQARLDDFLRAVRERGFHVFGVPACTEGSVRITLDLAPDQVEEFLEAVRAGAFARFHARHVESRSRTGLAEVVRQAEQLAGAAGGDARASLPQEALARLPRGAEDLDASIFDPSGGGPASRLDRMVTLWPALREAQTSESEDSRRAAQRLILDRYRPAIYRYLRACLDPEGADEVLQEFQLRFVQGGFRDANPEKGRFRDLLGSALHHLIVDYHRKRRGQLTPDVPEPAEPVVAADRQFLPQWRQSLLARTWEALADEERKTGRPMHTVLHYRAANPEMRSAQMAVELSARLNGPLTPDLVRKWLHAAREKFAEFLLAEVAASLRDPSPDALEQELIVLELSEYCKTALDACRGEVRGAGPAEVQSDVPGDAS